MIGKSYIYLHSGFKVRLYADVATFIDDWIGLIPLHTDLQVFFGPSGLSKRQCPDLTFHLDLDLFRILFRLGLPDL